MLLRQTLGFLGAQTLGPLAQLVSVIAWTHLATERDIGVITLVTVTQDLLAQVGLVWWTGYALRFYRVFDNSGRRDDFLNASLLVVGVSVALQSVLAIGNVLLFVDPSASAGFCLAVAAFVLFRGINAYNIIMASILEKPVNYTVFSLCGPIAGLVIGLGCMQVFGSSPFWPVLGYALGEGIAVLYGLLVWRKRPIDFKGLREILRGGWVYGLPIAISCAVEWVILNGPRYAVVTAMGMDEAGRFAVGFGLGQRASMLAAMAVTAAALPLAVKRNEEAGSEAGFLQLRDNLALLLGVMTPCLLGLHLVSGPLIRLVVGEIFWDSTLNVLPWALLAGGLTALTIHFLHHMLILEKKTWTLVITDGLTAVLTLAAVFPLMTQFGVAGAAMAIVVGRVIVGVYLLFTMLKRGLRLPWRSLAAITTASLAMTVAVMIVPESDEVLHIGLRCAFGAIVYFAVIAVWYADWVKPKLGRVMRPLLARIR